MATTAIVPNEDYSVDHDPSLKGFRLKGDQVSPGNNMVYGTDGSGIKGWQSATAADGSETEINAGANVTVTGSGTTADPYVIAASASGGTVEQDSLTVDGLTAKVDRQGGTATALTNPTAGEYELEVKAGAYMEGATVFGNNTNLNASQELELVIDNSANTRDRRFIVQVYNASNGALVDQQVTGTVHTQLVAGNVTTIKLPGMNGFGGTGFYIEIR